MRRVLIIVVVVLVLARTLLDGPSCRTSVTVQVAPSVLVMVGCPVVVLLAPTHFEMT